MLMLGATFKNDVVDIRNNKAIALAEHLGTRFGRVDVYDPHVNGIHGSGHGQIDSPFSGGGDYTVVIFAVAHSEFTGLTRKVDDMVSLAGVVIDVVSMLNRERTTDSGALIWTL